MKELNVILISLYLSYVSSRILTENGNKLVNSEPKAELQMRLKQKVEDNVIWTKGETKSARITLSSQDRNNSGREEKFIPKSSTKFLEHKERDDSESLTKAEMNDTWNKNRVPLRTESLFPGNNSMNNLVGSLSNHSQDVNHPNSSESSDVLVTGNLSSFALSEFEYENISDVIFSFDLTEETLSGKLIGSMHPFEPITSNDTFLFVEDDASLFQEVSTFGFEFLIDSETTRNSFLSELLISQNMSLADDVSDELSTLMRDWEHSTLENENFSIYEVINNTSLNEEIRIFLSTKQEVEDLGTEKINARDFNLTSSEQNRITEIIQVCPDPGWCFFWLFAEDTCAEDHHCLGSRICCKLGCAKTCIDV